MSVGRHTHLTLKLLYTTGIYKIIKIPARIRVEVNQVPAKEN